MKVDGIDLLQEASSPPLHCLVFFALGGSWKFQNSLALNDSSTLWPSDEGWEDVQVTIADRPEKEGGHTIVRVDGTEDVRNAQAALN